MSRLHPTPVESLRLRLRQALADRDRAELDYYAEAVELAAAEQERCCGGCSRGRAPNGRTIEESRVRTWWSYDRLTRLSREVIILEAELDKWII